jgi:hypothetical protein
MQKTLMPPKGGFEVQKTLCLQKEKGGAKKPYAS